MYVVTISRDKSESVVIHIAERKDFLAFMLRNTRPEAYPYTLHVQYIP
jgi:dsDNA-binding SOS-regulon protein